jgi:hypothetical protein
MLVDMTEMFGGSTPEEGIILAAPAEIGGAVVRQYGVSPKIPLKEEFRVKLVDPESPKSLSEEELLMKRLETLLPEHPESERLIGKVDEIMREAAKNEWFLEGIKEGSEPSSRYYIENDAIEEMLKDYAAKGLITPGMAENWQINLAGTVYYKIANARNPRARQPDEDTRQLVKGANEASAIEIIKLKAQLFINEAKKPKD